MCSVQVTLMMKPETHQRWCVKVSRSSWLSCMGRALSTRQRVGSRTSLSQGREVHPDTAAQPRTGDSTTGPAPDKASTF